MSPELQFWGAIAGILGLLIASLALLRDIFNFQLEPASTSNVLKRLIINRWIQLLLAIALLAFAYWSLYSRIQSLESFIANQEELITAAYNTQTKVDPFVKTHTK